MKKIFAPQRTIWKLKLAHRDDHLKRQLPSRLLPLLHHPDVICPMSNTHSVRHAECTLTVLLAITDLGCVLYTSVLNTNQL